MCVCVCVCISKRKEDVNIESIIIMCCYYKLAAFSRLCTIHRGDMSLEACRRVSHRVSKGKDTGEVSVYTVQFNNTSTFAKRTSFTCSLSDIAQLGIAFSLHFSYVQFIDVPPLDLKAGLVKLFQACVTCSKSGKNKCK